MCALGTGVQTCALPILWFFLRKYVPLSTTVFAVNFALFVLGALLILGSVFLGGYGGAWTFLYPLPVRSMGLWSNNAAVVFMLGYLAIGVGLLRSEEHTSELQSLMRISYAVFCLKKKNNILY